MISIKLLFSRKYISRIVLLLILLFAFVFSFVSYKVNYRTVRRTFIFPSADSGEYVLEYRNLAKKPVQGDVNFFIDELLLGSTIERTKTLFTPGTRVLSCFQRGNTLYLNLSKDLLDMGEGVIDIKSGMDLLTENITRNFSKIETVQIYVNGKNAFEK